MKEDCFDGFKVSHIILTHENFLETRIEGELIFAISTQFKKRFWSKERNYNYIQVIFSGRHPEIREALQSSDITYIDIFGQDSSHLEIRVPWEDDSRGLNKSQRTYFSKTGAFLYLEIGEKEW